MKDALFVLGDGAWRWVPMRSAVPSTIGHLKHSYLTGMGDMGAKFMLQTGLGVTSKMLTYVLLSPKLDLSRYC